MKVKKVINRVIRGKDNKNWMVVQHEYEYHLLKLNCGNCIIVWDSPLTINEVEHSLLKNAGIDAVFTDTNSSDNRVFEKPKPGQKYRHKTQDSGWFMVIENIDNTYSIINDQGYVQTGSDRLTYQEIQDRLANKILL